jgi:hypothetical protein
MCSVDGKFVGEVINQMLDMHIAFMDEGEPKEQMILAKELFNKNWKPGVYISHERCKNTDR